MKVRDVFAVLLLCITLPLACTQLGPRIEQYGSKGGIDIAVLSYDLSRTDELWIAEVAKRYPDAYIVLVHGDEDAVTGQWVARPSNGPRIPMRAVVGAVRAEYPYRRIVLIACNPGGIRFEGVENISYALNNVWTMPDAVVGWNSRDLWKPEYVGSIDEFVEQ